jgi:hypothetical protein
MPLTNLRFSLTRTKTDFFFYIRSERETKKSWLYQGLNNLWLQGDRPVSKPLCHKYFLISSASFFYFIELTSHCECCEQWKSLHWCMQTSQADVCKAFKHSLGTWYSKACFFFFSCGTKNILSLSLNVNVTRNSKPIKKRCLQVSNAGINLKKILQQSPITILPMFLADMQILP